MVTNIDCGALQSSTAAVASVQDLNFSDCCCASEAGFPPGSIWVIHRVDTSEFALAPVGVEFVSLDNVPWLHPGILPLRTHADPVILEGSSLWSY